jgi:peptidoglycan-N-acetylglucosamine deacetylase
LTDPDCVAQTRDEVADARAQVCLTFDFDAMSPWIDRTAAVPGDAAHPTSLSRGEFGARVGVPRVLKALARHDVRATFFVPGHTVDTFPSLCREIHVAGHEIAHHGYLHETPAMLRGDEERIALEKGIEAIVRHIGEKPRGYRAPTWDLSPRSLELLAEFGFAYDSSMMADDFSLYRCRVGDIPHAEQAYEFGRDADLVELPVSWSHSDFPYFELLLQPSVLAVLAPYENVRQTWLADFDFMLGEVPNGVYTLTLHPETIGRGARMRLLDDLILHMKDAGATFRRADEIVQEWAAAHPLDAG